MPNDEKPTDDMADFRPVEAELLVDLLVHGDNTAKNIAQNIDRHPQSIHQRAPELIEEGLVYRKGGGVIGLTARGVNVARVLYQDRES